MDASLAVVLLGHGTPGSLDDVPAFLANIRRGRAVPAELVTEVRRRYAAIGGRSPLLEISRSIATKLSSRTGAAVHVAMRSWQPLIADVLAELVSSGVRTVLSLPLAPYSPESYHAVVKTFAEANAARLGVIEAPAWHMSPPWIEGLERRVRAAMDSATSHGRTGLIMTAHSIPTHVVDAGDPYPRRVRETFNAIASRVGVSGTARLAFQSQGMTSDPWLGPDLHTALSEVRASGCDCVVVAAIGFPTDHVEVLYDLDIEACGWAESMGLHFVRAKSLNDADELIDALTQVVDSCVAATATPR